MIFSFWAVTHIPICRKTRVPISLQLVCGSSLDKNTPVTFMLPARFCCGCHAQLFKASAFSFSHHNAKIHLSLLCTTVTVSSMLILSLLSPTVCYAMSMMLDMSGVIQRDHRRSEARPFIVNVSVSLHFSLLDWSIEACDSVSYTEDSCSSSFKLSPCFGSMMQVSFSITFA